MDLKGKIVTVVGLGNSGFNAAALLCDEGAMVRVTDAAEGPDIRKNADILRGRGAAVETGGHTEGFVKGSALIVVSPGIESSSPVIGWAKRYAIPVTGEMELGYRFCRGRIIAITGTNGKSTVTTLTGEILKTAGLDAVVCGNIGNSLCGEIPRIGDKTWVVLEVSSFQLETAEKFKPRIAVILNITDDHLDRYRTFDDYYNEKLKIFRNQDGGDFLILNRDAKNLAALKETARSKVLFYGKSDAKDYPYLGSANLKGSHNIENMLASILAAKTAGAGEDPIRRAVLSFRGLAHRFETVATIGGVEYIDDSKGTTVDSTYRALESCASPVILIAGGRDKNSDYGVIKDLVSKKVRHLILIGEAKEKIRGILGRATKTHDAKTMEDAVRTASSLAGDGEIVLLSPMCSSFDMFTSYKQRGDAFRAAVTGLKEKVSGWKS